MIVNHTTWIDCENTPAGIALAMIEAKVPGDAKVVETEFYQGYVDPIYRGFYFASHSVVKIDRIKMLFEWQRDTGREESTVVPQYERVNIL